jgi:DNA-binding response OmpR family regulator
MVEPNLSLGNLWATVLEDAGFYVVLVRDGLSALAILQQEQIDMAILSTELPDADAYRLCSKLLRLPHRPVRLVLLLASDKNLLAVVHGKAVGAERVLKVPSSSKDAARFLEEFPQVCEQLLEISHFG